MGVVCWGPRLILRHPIPHPQFWPSLSTALDREQKWSWIGSLKGTRSEGPWDSEAESLPATIGLGSGYGTGRQRCPASLTQPGSPVSAQGRPAGAGDGHEGQEAGFHSGGGRKDRTREAKGIGHK